MPTSRAAALRWLAGRPEHIEEAGYRVEILLLADRIDDARNLLARLPAKTPWERFAHAALHDLVDWRAATTTSRRSRPRPTRSRRITKKIGSGPTLGLP